ncbi:class I SAM-dependent methyltransferase [Brachyspira sp.]|uniref:class I SAM-dependent methyltransferase n=1 Tax=Brachyspira sp. TaxID=1977261 RepID=UPI0026264FE4|nr:class I SAM-dependent methyltransferase [Brachyspira sp.]
MNVNFDGVSETLLITLYAKAEETKRKNSIIKDEKALDIINNINYDFSKFKNKGTQVGVSIRVKIIDDILKNIISNESCTIINLGAGLDTRAYRFINKNIYWYDIDFEDVINLRKEVFQELHNNDNYKAIPSSILNFDFIDRIEKKDKVIVIAEGVLMYMDENEIKMIIEEFSVKFNNCHFIFDTIPKFFVKNTKMHSTVKKTNAVFKWGLDKPRYIDKMSSHIQFIELYNIMNFYKNRWGFMNIFSYIPLLNNIVNFNIIHIKII